MRGYYWPLFAVLMGFALGGSFVAAFYPIPQTQQQKSPTDNTSHEGNYDYPLKAFWRWTTHDPVAFYTSVLALFTGLLVTVSTIQIAFLIRADQATQRTLVLAQRPKLRVRNIVVSHPPVFPREPPPLFTEGHPLQCQFFVANIGGTPAMIIEAFAMIFQTRAGLPMHRPYEGSNGNLAVPRGRLAPGQSFPLTFVSDEVIGEGAQTIGNTQIIRGVRLFVMGWIEYSDDIGIVRRTAFCREFKAGPWDDGRFRRVKNRDYEHEE
jgi:hypothetical protein